MPSLDKLDQRQKVECGDLGTLHIIRKSHVVCSGMITHLSETAANVLSISDQLAIDELLDNLLEIPH